MTKAVLTARLSYRSHGCPSPIDEQIDAVDVTAGVRAQQQRRSDQIVGPAEAPGGYAFCQGLALHDHLVAIPRGEDRAGSEVVDGDTLTSDLAGEAQDPVELRGLGAG